MNPHTNFCPQYPAQPPFLFSSSVNFSCFSSQEPQSLSPHLSKVTAQLEFHLLAEQQAESKSHHLSLSVSHISRLHTVLHSLLVNDSKQLTHILSIFIVVLSRRTSLLQASL